MRVLVAGATGAIGARLVPRLVARGHRVTATTRSPEKLAMLHAPGVTPVLMDGLDAVSVGEAVARARPDAIVHQMTSLSRRTGFRNFDRTFATTNALRVRGTDYLLAAAAAAGAGLFIAQSYTGWPNERTGCLVKDETDPLDPAPPAAQVRTLEAIRYLETAVTSATAVAGIVLRYGSFYGPGLSDQVADLIRRRRFPILGDGAGMWSFIHVDDAAAATVAALDGAAPGIYNVVDDEPAPVAEWLPWFARVLGARPPRRVPAWAGRIAAGEVGVSMMTQIRGSSNAKARNALDWKPSWPSWRIGFRDGRGTSA